MLSFAFSFADQVHDKTGGNKGQREYHADSHEDVHDTIVAEKKSSAMRLKENINRTEVKKLRVVSSKKFHLQSLIRELFFRVIHWVV